MTSEQGDKITFENNDPSSMSGFATGEETYDDVTDTDVNIEGPGILTERSYDEEIHLTTDRSCDIVDGRTVDDCIIVDNVIDPT